MDRSALEIKREIGFEEDVDLALLPDHLAECLRGVKASTVTVQGNRVTFTAGLFRFVSNWNVLNAFGAGELTIDAEVQEVEYRLSVRQFILVACVVGCVIVFPVVLSLRLWQLLALAPFFWIWIVGVNLAFGTHGFRGFMRHALATAPRCC